MKKLSTLLVSIFLCASALPVLAASSADDQQSANPKPHRPPQVAIEACKGLTEHASCQFNGRNNELVSGVCDVPPGNADTAVLACHPEHGAHDRPPQEKSTN